MVVTAEDVKDELAFDEIALGIDSEAFDNLIEDLIGRENEIVVDVLFADTLEELGLVLGQRSACWTVREVTNEAPISTLTSDFA